MGFYENQISLLENSNDVISDFQDEINDYLKYESGSQESNLYKEGIIGKAKKLEKEKFNALIEHISSLMKKTKGDNKLQLLELWSNLNNVTNNSIVEKIGQNQNKDFEIARGYISKKTLSWNGGKIGTKNIKYKMGNDTIKNLGIINDESRYEINVNFGYDGYRTETFQIGYNGNNVMKLYDKNGKFIDRFIIAYKSATIEQGRFFSKGQYYSKRYKTPGIATINNNKLKINIDFIFHRVDKNSLIK